MGNGMRARLSRQIESPPVWLLVFLALAVVQRMYLPLVPTGRLLDAVGLALILAGVAVMAAAFAAFARAKTTILPRERPAHLIRSGIYRFSRNPIYLADVAILSGAVLRWDLGSLPLVAVYVAILTQRFIRGEEAGCAAAFGVEWRDYAARVRRWL